MKLNCRLIGEKRQIPKLSILLKIILLIVLILFSNTSNPFDKAFSDIITFISLAIGFCITSLSILATSTQIVTADLVHRLKGNELSLFEELVRIFKKSILYFTLTICLILMYKYLEPNFLIWTLFKLKIDLMAKLAGVIWSLTIISILSFGILMNFFLNYVSKECNR